MPGLIFQETVSPAAAANVDIPLTTAGAVAYEIIFELVGSAAGNGDNIELNVTNDAFVSVENTGTPYKWNDARARGATPTNTVTGSESEDFIQMLTNLGTAAGEFAMGRIQVNFPHDTGVGTNFEFKFTRINATGELFSTFGGAFYVTAESINGFRLAFDDLTGSPTFTGTVHIFALVS